jgi:enoyl-CoA hydratase/carnithine racemase
MAGADLKMMMRISRKELAAYMKRIQDIFSDLEALSQPTIAVIGGHALGEDCEIALCCVFPLCPAGRQESACRR